MLKLRQHFRAAFYAWLIWFGIILFVPFCSLLLFSYERRYKPIFIGFSPLYLPTLVFYFSMTSKGHFLFGWLVLIVLWLSA
jgi:hypothetical protein